MSLKYEDLKNNFFIIGKYKYITFDNDILDKIKLLNTIFLKNNIIYVLKFNINFQMGSSLNPNNNSELNNSLELIKKIKEELNIPILIETIEINILKKFEKFVDIIMIPTFIYNNDLFIKNIAYSKKIILIKSDKYSSIDQIFSLKSKLQIYDNSNIVLCDCATNNSEFQNNLYKFNICPIKGNESLTSLDISNCNFLLQEKTNLISESNTSSIRQFIPFLNNQLTCTEINGVLLNIRHYLEISKEELENKIKIVINNLQHKKGE